MGHRGVVVSGMNAVLTALLLLWLSGCNTTSPPADNNSLSLYSPTESNLFAGVTVSGTLDTDLFLTRTRQKGPGNPGPDGTVGPPSNVPGPGGGTQTGTDTSGDVSTDSGTTGGNVGPGNGPPDGVPGPPGGTTGTTDGTTGTNDGTTAGPPPGVPGPPTGSPGPQNAGQGNGPGTGAGPGTGRAGGAAMTTVINQYSLVFILGGTGLYGVPDADGQFQIRNCPAGDYILSLYHDGELAGKKSIRLTSSDLDLGQITGIDDDGLLIYTGSDGFASQDGNGDGTTDTTDANGNGNNDLTGTVTETE